MPSHVYVAGYVPHPEIRFVKIGKANSPEKRVKAYQTHLPGGLTFMVAAGVWNEPAAYMREAELLSFAHGHPEIKSAGGEWFAVSDTGLDALLERIQAIDGDAFMVELPKVKAVKGRHSGRVNPKRDEINRWREAGRRSPSGVSGAYSGTQRG